MQTVRSRSKKYLDKYLDLKKNISPENCNIILIDNDFKKLLVCNCLMTKCDLTTSKTLMNQ